MKEVMDLVAKAEKFLKTAEVALTVGDYDSCASRCYYAMFFLRKRPFLPGASGLPPTRGSSVCLANIL